MTIIWYITKMHFQTSYRHLTFHYKNYKYSLYTYTPKQTLYKS